MMALDIDKSNPNMSVPIPNPCLSYWQRTTRAFPLLKANHNTTIPQYARYVIIGSGLSGALTAFELVEGGVPGSDIIMLEAREAASGASSRNAGHVRPDAFRGFATYSKIHGVEQALKIIANERLVLEKVDEFVRKHEIACDFHLTTTFDVCMTEEFAEYEASSLKAYEAARGDISHVRFHEGDDARERTRVKGAVAAYEWPAGSSHPAKLTHWLLKDVVSKGVRLFTHCPATAITQSQALDETQNSHMLWQISTPSGIVGTPTVIHCTNAHAALLLPQLAPHLKPNKAQAHSLIPGPSFSGENVLENTMSLRYSLLHFYSLIQRRSDGTLILGVSRLNPSLSAEVQDGLVSFDDSSYNEEICQDALRQFDVLFPPENGLVGCHGEGLDHAWSGIIAMTTDSVPFVGAVDALPGQYICAGFNGHGKCSHDFLSYTHFQLWFCVLAASLSLDSASHDAERLLSYRCG